VAGEQRLIGPSAALIDGGDGLRFVATCRGEQRQAFCVRFRGRVYAFVNQCRHEGSELDWEAGRFFDADGLYLVCATHGARYAPDSGRCVAGPCRGARLTPVAVEEKDGAIYCVNE
jgi:nitrite reductase/ring-hydroxylating ferredoxin subunit